METSVWRKPDGSITLLKKLNDREIELRKSAGWEKLA